MKRPTHWSVSLIGTRHELGDKFKLVHLELLKAKAPMPRNSRGGPLRSWLAWPLGTGPLRRRDPEAVRIQAWLLYLTKMGSYQNLVYR